MKLSIIVPVYNVEKYINAFLRYLINKQMIMKLLLLTMALKIRV